MVHPPLYPRATQPRPPFVLDFLNARYGHENVVWPTIVSWAETGATVAYVYDRNIHDIVNNQGDNRPQSISGVPNVFLDYTAVPRALPPGADQQLQPMIAPQHNRVYDFMINRQVNLGYTATDINLIWNNGENWRGMEFTTFYMPFTSVVEAERLVSMINRRPSWRGAQGPIAFENMIDAADDLNIELIMVCVNTLGRADNTYRMNGNAYWFPLNRPQLRRLLNGAVPTNARFDTVQTMLNSL